MSTPLRVTEGNLVSQPQSPQATYQSPGRTPERASQEKRHSIGSTISRGSSLPTFVYKQGSPISQVEHDFRRSSSFKSQTVSEETLHHKLNTMMSDRASTASLIAYLAITVPVLAILSFVYSLCTAIPLIAACACHASSLRSAIMAGHEQLFSIHASKMELKHPGEVKNTLLLSLCTFPISILVSMSGFFALASKLYSRLLSEVDSDSSSLDRAMSFWYSWLDLFCEDLVLNKTDDLV